MDDLDAEYLANKSSIFGNTEAEDTKSRGVSDNEDSAGSQDNEDISMKKQGSYTVYDRIPAKRGRWYPQAPTYTAKRNPRYIYKKKGDNSSNEEDTYKRKDAGDGAPDTNDSGDDRDNDTSKYKKEKVTNPDNAWKLFLSVCKLTPKCI